MTILRDRGVTLASVIGNYLRQGVAPLMVRWLPLFKMTAETLSDGSQLSALLPSDVEIDHWLTEAMEVYKDVGGAVVPYVFLILGCPPMCPKMGFVEFVSSFGSTPPFLVLHPPTPSSSFL